MLLVGGFAAVAVPALAQAQNLEAGKSPSQIFSGTCSVCHKSPRGLLKTVPAGSLPGFLRQHYTTSSDMAGLLSSFLVSNGANDTRYIGTQTKQGAKPDKDAKSDARPAAPAEQLDRHGRRTHSPVAPQEAARPDTKPQQAETPEDEELAPQADPRRHGRNARRLARPTETPDVARPSGDRHVPIQAAGERGPDGRKSGAKQRRSKPGGEELPKTDAVKDDLSRGESLRQDIPSSDAAKYDDKPEAEIPSREGRSEAPRIDPPRDSAAVRPDPVPPVTPAPQAFPAASTAVSSGSPEPPAGVPAPPPAPALTASVPPPAPAAPAGPPTPPISQ
jgi:hypothetical protein